MPDLPLVSPDPDDDEGTPQGSDGDCEEEDIPYHHEGGGEG